MFKTNSAFAPGLKGEEAQCFGLEAADGIDDASIRKLAADDGAHVPYRVIEEWVHSLREEARLQLGRDGQEYLDQLADEIESYLKG